MCKQYDRYRGYREIGEEREGERLKELKSRLER